MKYIRTKNKIREIIKDFGSSCSVKSSFLKGRPSIDNFTVVNGVSFAPRADTIEELCDEFVICEKPFYLQPYLWTGNSKKLFAKNIVKNIKSLKIEVYSAIWTDKGLIYVAKMNEKGELELL